MNWVNTFYQKQASLCGDCYYHKVEKQNEDKVAIVKHFKTKQDNILDIGAGGGQNALAMAKFAKHVDAIELLFDFVQFGKNLVEKEGSTNCTVNQGDFYSYNPEKKYKVVTYWDGFGVGDDNEQRHLLSNISSWLQDDGKAFVEVYTPWYANYSANKEMTFGNAKRRYGFDFENCRWLDSWWEIGKEDEVVHQSLRCYTPADFKLLLQGSGLVLETIRPCLNSQNFDELYSGQLETAVSYVAVLRKG